jgi:general secretion pathway protein F
MPTFHYRALTQAGEVVSGSIAAPTAGEVAHRIEYLGLVLIETISEQRESPAKRQGGSLFSQPRPEDITIFTNDLALLLKAGSRIDDALALLAADIDVGRLRPVVGQIKGKVVAGESFAEALSHFSRLFPDIYVAMVRVGEASGTLDHVLESLARERMRKEAMQRKVADALRYPAFILLAAGAVLVFFLMFVLPQFASVLQDFGAKLDPIVLSFLALSHFMRENTTAIGLGLLIALIAGWVALRRPAVRAAIAGGISRLPLARTIFTYYRTALFCRNLGVLLQSGVPLTTTLRILVDMMATTGNAGGWRLAAERVRHGGRLSDGLEESGALAGVAVRMIKLGEETGQLPVLAGHVADFYETKLQRSLDRIVGIVGPAAIVLISTVVGGLIVSVMSALLSVTQIIG